MTRPLTEDQRLLQDSAREFFAERAPVSALRAERDAGRPHDPQLWREIAELGFAGAAVPEEHGGSGMGWRALGIVLEAAGRTLVASPLTQTGLVGVAAVRALGNEAQRARLLPLLAAGTVTTALAFDEGAHHAPTGIAMRAVREGDGWRLDGRKRFVPDGATASHILVAALAAPAPGAAETLSLFIVDATAAGLTRKPLAMADSRGMADIGLTGVRVTDDARLNGDAGAGDTGALERVLDIARIGLAAEMLGAADALFTLTLAYLKDRRQFGQPIGAFQALQHRAARMFVDLELTRSCVTAALDALDDAEGGDKAAAAATAQIPALASLVKARAGDTLHLVSNEAVQLHGGIGMTDAFDAGLYLKRARVLETLYGSAGWHRDRSARLEGY
ncbi:MAG: acyl-CoA dehydrogenase family protein [Gammaproteobacteria bacterium]